MQSHRNSRILQRRQEWAQRSKQENPQHLRRRYDQKQRRQQQQQQRDCELEVVLQQSQILVLM
jgi:hypothetical protein